MPGQMPDDMELCEWCKYAAAQWDAGRQWCYAPASMMDWLIANNYAWLMDQSQDKVKPLKRTIAKGHRCARRP